MLVVAFAPGCSTDAASTPTTSAVPKSSTTTPSVPVTTTARVTTTTTVAPTTTTIPVGGAPIVDMVPAGYDVEDFVPLIENYFAVRNWALEHPDEATQEILATVIEPGSAEMQTTMAEIQDLVDQNAHYEGLSETFRLIETDFVKATTDPPSGKVSVSLTVEYGDTTLLSSRETAIGTDTLRRDAWTLHFAVDGVRSWRVGSTLRNPTMHAPEQP
jgi:hypothetical protein